MNKKKTIIFLAIVTLILLGGNKTYSYYKSKATITATSTPANLKCDFEVLPGISKSKYGYSEIKVKIKNYEKKNGVEKISDLPFSYYVSIKNSSESNVKGIFGYKNRFGEEDSYRTLYVAGAMVNTSSKEEIIHTIQIKTDKNLSEDVKYDLDFKCIQRDDYYPTDDEIEGYGFYE